MRSNKVLETTVEESLKSRIKGQKLTNQQKYEIYIQI